MRRHPRIQTKLPLSSSCPRPCRPTLLLSTPLRKSYQLRQAEQLGGSIDGQCGVRERLDMPWDEKLVVYRVCAGGRRSVADRFHYRCQQLRVRLGAIPRPEGITKGFPDVELVAWTQREKAGSEQCR
jgi:hypothetical protein